MTAMLPNERIERLIILIRGHKVMLDADLAELYGVETRALIQAVKRNLSHFPADFMFQLTKEEFESLRSQIVISNSQSQSAISSSGRGGRRHLPYAFTEQGVAMLSSVLKSKQAVESQYRDHAGLCSLTSNPCFKCTARQKTRGIGKEIRRAVQSCIRCDPAAHGTAGAEQTEDRISG